MEIRVDLYLLYIYHNRSRRVSLLYYTLLYLYKYYTTHGKYSASQPFLSVPKPHGSPQLKKVRKH